MRRCPKCGATYPGGEQFCSVDGTETETPENVDRDANEGRVLGRYRLIKLLGEGGMGMVYLGEHIKIKRKVAIKMLHPQFATQKEVVARFFTEAQVVNAIEHDNIININDFVELDDQTVFLVMELLKGHDLGQDIKAKGPIDPLRLIFIAQQVCSALNAVHEVGIIHRDLKPDNVYLTDRSGYSDFVKLLDFGIAKLTGAGAHHKTKTGMVLGTPYYMSPEQCGGTEIDQRSDIYSLGVILYECLTGRVPFKAETYAKILLKHLTEIPPPPHERLQGGRGLPAPLEHVVLRCMAKDPAERFQNMGELIEALEGCKDAAMEYTELTTPDGQPLSSNTPYPGPHPTPFPGGSATGTPYGMHIGGTRKGMGPNPGTQTSNLKPSGQVPAAAGSAPVASGSMPIVEGGPGPGTPGTLHPVSVSNTRAAVAAAGLGGGRIALILIVLLVLALGGGGAVFLFAFDGMEVLRDNGVLAAVGMEETSDHSDGDRDRDRADDEDKGDDDDGDDKGDDDDGDDKGDDDDGDDKGDDDDGDDKGDDDDDGAGVEAPEEVEMTFLSEPKGATVLIDGKERGTTPVAMDLPVSEEPLAVLFRLEGAEHTESVVVAKAGEVSVDLSEEISALSSASIDKGTKGKASKGKGAKGKGGKGKGRTDTSSGTSAPTPPKTAKPKKDKLRTDVKDPFAS